MNDVSVGTLPQAGVEQATKPPEPSARRADLDAKQALVADLLREAGRDRPVADWKLVAEPIARLRRTLSPYEQDCLRELGQIVGHAVEATCRTLAVGQTELEVAGQLGHRLRHRGADPVSVFVAVDGR